MKSHESSKPPTPEMRSKTAALQSELDLETELRVSAGTSHCAPRILIADDDSTVRESLSDVLVSEGFVVIPANDGRQALDIAKSGQIDLVLLDLNMPVKNGWETFEQLSREHPLVPVIIVTARPNQLFTAIGAGVGALLEKPMEIPTLLRTIRRLLREPVETRMARIAGRETDFHYSAANPQEIKSNDGAALVSS